MDMEDAGAIVGGTLACVAIALVIISVGLGVLQLIANIVS